MRSTAVAQVVSAYNDLKASLAEHAAAVALHAAATTAYAAAFDAYRQGVGTYTDVANEGAALANAGASREDAHANAFTAAAALAFAIGAARGRVDGRAPRPGALAPWRLRRARAASFRFSVAVEAA